MKKKESDLQLQRKRQNCVVVVVVAAGVWCVRMVARGGEYLYTVAHAEEPRFVEDPSEVYSMAYVMK
jgi:hypothetical protein